MTSSKWPTKTDSEGRIRCVSRTRKIQNTRIMALLTKMVIVSITVRHKERKNLLKTNKDVEDE